MRSYGLGGPDPKDYMEGPPRVLEYSQHIVCPNCRCSIALIEFIVREYPGSNGRTGTGTYMGCPACTWASPCILVFERST